MGTQVALAAPGTLPANWALELADGLAFEAARAGAGVVGAEPIPRGLAGQPASPGPPGVSGDGGPDRTVAVMHTSGTTAAPNHFRPSI